MNFLQLPLTLIPSPNLFKLPEIDLRIKVRGKILAMAAGIAMLNILKRPSFYTDLEDKSDWFAEELTKIAQTAGVPTTLNRIGSMMTCFFTKEEVRDYTTAMTADTARYASHYRNMLANGVWLAPSQFEAFFLSAAHDRDVLQGVLEATAKSFKKLMD